MITTEYTLHTRKKAVILAMRVSAVAVISSIALFFLARSIATTTENIVVSRNEFTALTTQYDALDRSERDRETAKGAADTLAAMLPTPDTIPVVEDFLYSAARKTDTTLILSFDQSPKPSAIETLDELAISLQTEGGEQSLLAFLSLLENAPHLIAVRGVSLHVNAPGQLAARISAAVYLKQNQ